MHSAQRLPAEVQYADELNHLAENDTYKKPQGWKLSPQAVKTFILGSNKAIGNRTIAKKIHGNDALVERAIVTLAGQRGLLLVGEPGTAKSLLSELLAAAISGNSTDTIQGSAGIVEENIRYSWNYALLLKEGPVLDSLVPGPLYRAMKHGRIMRFEEITRCPTEIQDNLIPILSDRILQIPELKQDEDKFLLSQKGFNLIATANLNDRGVNEMSSALKRRFNFETMQPLKNIQQQAKLIATQANQQLASAEIEISASDDICQLLATAITDMRTGHVEGLSISPLSNVLSTAEAISVLYSAALESYYFGEQTIRPKYIANYLIGAVCKDNNDDIKRFEDYKNAIKRKRNDLPLWQDFIC